MKRFCNFPSELWSYFLEVDQRFNGPATTKPSPGMVSPRHRDFHHIKAVIWDVYGTLCSLDYGDLEKTLQWHEILRPAAKTTIEEFHLRDNLLQCYPSDEPEAKLVELFLEQIDQSHQASRDRGIEHPEVVIEIIWQKILDPLCKENNVHHSSESKSQTSYRIAYFFDACLQKMTLFDGMAQCLGTIKESGLVQGIISNAQFYTPIRLRRLIRLALEAPDFELEDVFTESLVLFSHELGFSKPNPGAFQLAIDTLNKQHITPKETLYIGNDMLNDVTAAQHAGLHTVLLAANDSQVILRKDDPRCQNIEPDAIVTSASQIMDLISGQ